MNTNASGGEVHCLSSQRFLPFCLQSCDVRNRDFLSSIGFVHRRLLAPSLGPCGPASLRSLGWGLKASRLPGMLAHDTPPNRVYLGVLTDPSITDWHFVFSCSPRSDYAAAVTFHYRRFDPRLTGTFTPLRLRPSQSHIGVGTMDYTSPLPPNRTGGSPASGFRVSDCPLGIEAIEPEVLLG